MKMTIDLDDDMFDEAVLTRLKRDLQMLKNDLNRGVHQDDVTWMIPVKNALEVAIALYYGTGEDRNSIASTGE